MWLWRKFHRLMEFFDIYEIEPSFSISENELKKKYLVLQKKFHPDRFAHSSIEEQKTALINSSLINDAYQVLKDDIRRAKYLLECNGVEITNHTNPAFLMKQMEYEEKIEDHSNDKNQLLSIQKELQEELDQYKDNLTVDFDKKNFDRATNQINEFIFIDKLHLKIKEKINQLS
ncbi:MAG: Fe-S protein assembly co-chaperone HscB [Betaproteobacteria bacterium]|jgi:molecular chaperone HscB|nr:Fe-S protein assembly co-chaperone HscB [Nitrosomonadales bacterium]NCV37705.1 Fe-S protein assembly co-chaperone HscB [Betaproteobacteria bacterium]NCV53187.1 Fe-S protein assembly co-chaperone HscB [Betaproteobacteria bacterium]NCX67534.1 Fe-S protein assembly co-chaperone HscB [Betaproteobacteria bacterium]